MTDYILDNTYIKGSGYGSLGMTNKYYKDGYWYKQNCNGYEGKSEYLCSMLLKHSNLTEYVEYEECYINGKAGCRSRNFTESGEQVVTFHKLYLAVIRSGNLWKTAPLFDFGASFFSLQHVFKKEMSFEEKLAIMTPQPFSPDFETQARALGSCRIELDYEGIGTALSKEDTALQEIIFYQLEKYKEIFQKK